MNNKTMNTQSIIQRLAALALLACFVLGMLLLASSTATAQTFTGADLGTPALPGSVTDNGFGIKTIRGGGADIWNKADSG